MLSKARCDLVQHYAEGSNTKRAYHDFSDLSASSVMDYACLRFATNTYSSRRHPLRVVMRGPAPEDAFELCDWAGGEKTYVASPTHSRAVDERHP